MKNKNIAFILAKVFSPFPICQSKLAFTLAEVLITLGIIGIVAALTLPNLIVDYQKKQTSAQLKKAYSTFAQALAKSQYDNEASINWTTTEPSSTYQENYEYFEKYWMPYFKIIKICKTYSECGYEKPGFANLLEKTNFIYYGQSRSVPAFIYGDGTYAYIRPYSYNSTEDNKQRLQLILIDLNGPKKPNIMGKDVFQFEIDINKGNIAGYGKPETCAAGKLINEESPRSCGGKIMADGWEIKDDYPW